jgi:hypothetical protein
MIVFLYAVKYCRRRKDTNILKVFKETVTKCRNSCHLYIRCHIFPGFRDADTEIHRPALCLVVVGTEEVDHQRAALVRQVAHGAKVGAVPCRRIRRSKLQGRLRRHIHHSGTKMTSLSHFHFLYKRCV